MSVLENYHLYVLMNLIEQTNLLSGLTYAQMQHVKDTIKEIVLRTDMSLHFNIQSEMDSIINQLQESQELTNQAKVLNDKEKKVSLLDYHETKFSI